MNCIKHEKASGNWKSAKDDCQKELRGCISECTLAANGGWGPESCQKAIEPILALIEGAKAESDQAVEGSRETLKALTGGDDAAIDKMIADGYELVFTVATESERLRRTIVARGYRTGRSDKKSIVPG